MSDCRIAHLSITRHEARSPDPSEACLWLGYFIEEALERGWNENELPPDAMQFAALWDYHGERANGGHAQYYENRDGDLTALRNGSELLGRIGLSQHGKLIDRFIEVANTNEDYIHELYVSGNNQDVKAIFYDLDDSFAELEISEGKLLHHLHDWVLQQSWVVVDGADGPANTDWLRHIVPEPPLRAARMAARERRRHAEHHGSMMALIQKLWRR
ncbi:hypothetical protein J2Y58_002524 [Sphingomonas sp. BE138]|uniref:DMP19 family protein n=1 Tax=Sphingomonas sp. BE138 TaxID=2817845 RepID=UPI002866FD3F|nr:DUF4375 domain-containing protein [Sphingomonas sp. BE138]MDR6789153.1 hypothetical protein [Sphingomonas sp. BE138]